MIPLDYHVHSTFSPDSPAIPEKLCHRAIELGIPELGFSEHWDVGPYEDTTRFLKPEAWWNELERLRVLFAGQLTIRAGIEIAEPHLYPEDTTGILSRLPFDYVLGSVHFVGEHMMFDENYFHQHTADEVYSAYFAEMDRMVRIADINVVAHFDIPARTAKPILGYEPARYEDVIRTTLAVIIERGLALDVNVSGLRKLAQNIMPDPLILHWYHEMGGERVTLGSDAHRVEHLGLHLDQAVKAIQEAGLTHVTQFEQRRSRLVPIG